MWVRNFTGVRPKLGEKQPPPAATLEANPRFETKVITPAAGKAELKSQSPSSSSDFVVDEESLPDPDQAPAFLIRKPEEAALPPPDELIKDMVINSCAIEPSRISSKPSSPVIIRVLAQDSDYTFYIPDLEIKSTLQKGETKSISFQAPSTQEELVIKLACDPADSGNTVGAGFLDVTVE